MFLSMVLLAGWTDSISCKQEDKKLHDIQIYEELLKQD